MTENQEFEIEIPLADLTIPALEGKAEQLRRELRNVGAAPRKNPPMMPFYVHEPKEDIEFRQHLFTVGGDVREGESITLLQLLKDCVTEDELKRVPQGFLNGLAFFKLNIPEFSCSECDRSIYAYFEAQKISFDKNQNFENDKRAYESHQVRYRNELIGYIKDLEHQLVEAQDNEKKEFERLFKKYGKL